MSKSFREATSPIVSKLVPSNPLLEQPHLSKTFKEATAPYSANLYLRFRYLRRKTASFFFVEKNVFRVEKIDSCALLWFVLCPVSVFEHAFSTVGRIEALLAGCRECGHGELFGLSPRSDCDQTSCYQLSRRPFRYHSD